MDRPITTLFMLTSVDGKISTGATDELDVDQDFPIPCKSGLRDSEWIFHQIRRNRKR